MAGSQIRIAKQIVHARFPRVQEKMVEMFVLLEHISELGLLVPQILETSLSMRVLIFGKESNKARRSFFGFCEYLSFRSKWSGQFSTHLYSGTNIESREGQSPGVDFLCKSE